MTNPARAHNPFDNSVHSTLFENELEVSVTLGADAAGLFLRLAAPDHQAALGGMGVKPLPAAAAAQLAEIKSDQTPIQATSLELMGDGLEHTFVARYPRPTSGNLTFRAIYYDLAPDLMKLGTFVLNDEAGRQLASGLLTKGSTTLELALPKASASIVLAPQASNSNQATAGAPVAVASSLAANPTPHPALGRFLLLGIQHILTGYDHLLFLCALLVACDRIKPMLAIVTCFTLAHSVTLALAALDVVKISSRVVEPLIAASIVFVGVENFRGKVDVKTRCAVTLGFGLIHGFGFAGALRESGLAGRGMELVPPLFGFNLGVEFGQLAVAAVFLPLLFLARRTAQFQKYGPVAISACVLGLGGFWLVQRLFTP